MPFLKDLISSLAMGIVQGASEFLPVSSSGHLAVIGRFFPRPGNDLFYIIVLHMGTVFAVLTVFGRDICETAFIKKDVRFFLNLFITTVVTVIPVLLFKDIIKNAFASLTMVGICLIATGVINLIAQTLIKKNTGSVRKPDSFDAFLIGVFQAFAALPGVSRSGSTIMSAMIRGTAPETAYRYSFFAAVPIIIGAFVLDLKGSSTQGAATLPFHLYAAGFLAAFASGYFALKLLKRTIMSQKYHIFGIYAVCAGIAVLFSEAFL